MKPLQKVTLCPACGACPEVAVYGEKVSIGEKGNQVHLTKMEWNELVKKIKTGELKEL